MNKSGLKMKGKSIKTFNLQVWEHRKMGLYFMLFFLMLKWVGAEVEISQCILSVGLMGGSSVSTN